MEIKEYRNFDMTEVQRLYSSVGWQAYTEDMAALQRGFENSLLVLGAYENGELLGIIRTVGDGATILFIQDILVFPERQRQGIGRVLVKAVIERFADVRQVELVTDNAPDTVAFYKALGFRELSEIGCCGFMRC
ncbi:GNAT family N-acetyltransferase [Ruminococcus sp.]|uniref:GNAT family N-acetyltransferase n=1 Tax=Ruminococcus sp. TaxID=41978 RepID=UPI0025FC0791|nr:GNAT family N-acetyltransferase [Ruminococcus sp.]MBQ8966568.1 GNAT family N-acetyltransferase [Ruminococcus sp.]